MYFVGVIDAKELRRDSLCFLFQILLFPVNTCTTVFVSLKNLFQFFYSFNFARCAEDVLKKLVGLSSRVNKHPQQSIYDQSCDHLVCPGSDATLPCLSIWLRVSAFKDRFATRRMAVVDRHISMVLVHGTAFAHWLVLAFARASHLLCWAVHAIITTFIRSSTIPNCLETPREVYWKSVAPVPIVLPSTVTVAIASVSTIATFSSRGRVLTTRASWAVSWMALQLRRYA